MPNLFNKQKISIARESLKRSRELKRSRASVGVEGIRQFVTDVDGDWLENWNALDEKENI